MKILVSACLLGANCRYDGGNNQRSQVLELFRAGKVFVGGRLYENNSGQPKEGEVISLRGFGRFIYGGVTYETKKGRYMVRVQEYR